LLNVDIHEHQFKRKGKYCKFHFDKEAYSKPKTSDLYTLSWKSSYDGMLFMCQSRQQQFHGFVICVIFRPRDLQEYYMLFGIFARDTSLYSLSVFYIAWADFQYTHFYLFCVLHHWAFLTREYHGTAAFQAHTTSIYDVIA
jgi:hypothetical protein